jgi:hypothetical protein
MPGKTCTKCPQKSHAKGLCSTCYGRVFRKNHPNWGKICWSRMRLDPRKELLKAARRRAKHRNRPFSITLQDIVIPEVCPILGIRLESSKDFPTEESPSLDEVVVGRGYVAGNIQIISRKANTMKSNATPEELLKFSIWVQRTYES